MQTDAFTEALLREKRQATSGASSSTDTGPDISEGVCVSYQNALACPFCPKEPLDFQGLVQHLDDVHASYPQRAARCPICRRTARDMVPHLLQHVGTFGQDDDCDCSSPMHGAPAPLVSEPGTQGPLQELQGVGSADGQALPSSGGQASAAPAQATSCKDEGGPSMSKPEPDKKELLPSEAVPLGPSVEASKATEPPPPQPGGLQDTPETRAAFVQQMMLGVFGLGR